ncbi:MAG: hypothetical protein MUF83_16045 [Acidimicrobiales bacterium]|nr:hypothetical protein [Acidimicrobiales bacterium]
MLVEASLRSLLPNFASPFGDTVSNRPNIRPKIEAALSATADRLNPGSGAKAVHHAKNDLATIGGTEEDFNSRYADEEVEIASPAVFEAKHPDGDPVTFKKHHDGVIIVFSDSFLFVRRMGFALREIKALRTDEVSVERVTTVLDGTEVPGLRITGPGGKPTFALAIAESKEPGNPTEQAAVRDEIYELLTR